MATVILKTNETSLEINVTERGMVDEYNLAVAIVKAIRAFDGAFVKTYGDNLETLVKMKFKEGKKQRIKSKLPKPGNLSDNDERLK